ncbi:hypothetical protein LAZ67_2001643 [Cordylochernes scorpioides]|uniref:Mos1 transposase HTH domain-containing protein n=1 Tax=Cordylochernes scorpioides TaxID=51811 RepID=A0ABY6K4L6_9ARAC|nr:hypothetical protein LAZ67_2001643 [Cordylochernes scorpioides]
MPFGQCNARATIERMMTKILKGLKCKMALCYLDDIVVCKYPTEKKCHNFIIFENSNGLNIKSSVLDRLQFLPIKKMDQRSYIKFCVKNEIKFADAFRMLTVAYGEATLDRSNVYRWYKMFSEGREDVNDEELAGRPSTSTTDEKIN